MSTAQCPGHDAVVDRRLVVQQHRRAARDRIAAMAPADRALAERVHATVTADAAQPRILVRIQS